MSPEAINFSCGDGGRQYICTAWLVSTWASAVLGLPSLRFGDPGTIVSASLQSACVPGKRLSSYCLEGKVFLF